jgi:hypothetical protein
MKARFWFVIFGFYLLLGGSVYGKPQLISGKDTLTSPQVDSLFNILEIKNGIRFFYEEEIIHGQKLPSSIFDLPLEEALNRLGQILKCGYVIVDSTSYVLMPLGVQINLPVKDNGLIIIGNPNDYGKYKRAIFTGTILDGKTGEPLTGAVAEIKKLNIAVSTDKNGKFILNLPVGEYEFELSYFNFNRSLERIKIVSDGAASFNLIEKLFALDEVIVRAEKSESNISYTQMSLMRLDSKSIRELPQFMGEKDIIRGMTLLPGIQSVGEFGTGFNVRGGSADQNLILVEDAPLFNSSHLFGFESVINPDVVSGLTILKAGIPAQYGERASSAMNISLGNNPQKMQVKGGIGLLSSRLNIETPLGKGKTDLLVGGRSSYSDWILHNLPDADLMNSNANFYDLNTLLNIKINQKNKITLFGYFSNDKFTYNIINHYDYSSLLGTFRWSHIFSNKLSSTLLSCYSLYNYNYTEYDTQLAVGAYKISSSLQYNSLKYNFSWNANTKYTFDFGFNGILYRSHPGDKKPFGSQSITVPVIIDQEKGAELAVYLSGNFNITENLSGEAGIRYSAFSLLGPGTEYTYMPFHSMSTNTRTDTIYYGNNSVIKWYSGLEPRLSLRYNLNDHSSVKLSYNRINQYINLISNTSVAIPSDIWKLSSPQVKPLTADQVAIGYYRNFKSNSVETSLELYFKTLNNIVEYKNGAQVLLNEKVETDLLRAYGQNFGIELYAKKNTGKLTGWVSYTLSKAYRHTSSSIADDQINKNNPFPSNYDKPNNLNIVASYHFTRRWRLAGSFSYSTGRPVTLPESKFKYGPDWLIIYSARNKYRLPDYHRLDISVSYDESLWLKKKWRGSWTFSIINVYGRKNPYSTYYKKEIPTTANNNRYYSLYTLYIIGRPLPTLTYNFIF